MIIPANVNHQNLVPMAIGIHARCKINANIGNSAVTSDIDGELEKLARCVKYKADTVMDLSTGGNIDAIRQAILNHSPVPIGTVPIYQAIQEVKKAEDLTPDGLVDMIRRQAEQGVDYIHAMLVGYEENPPQGFQLPPGLFYNKYFPGHAISMPPPLGDGRVEYTDGSPTTVDQYAKDVTAFMMWAAEPKLEVRKRVGFQVMIFLLVFAGLLYFTKKKVWANAH